MCMCVFVYVSTEMIEAKMKSDSKKRVMNRRAVCCVCTSNVHGLV